MKTGVHPMKTKLKLFLDQGIIFEKIYETEEKSHRKVYYADKEELEVNIVRHTMNLNVDDEAVKRKAIIRTQEVMRLSFFANLYREEIPSRAKSVYMYLKDRNNAEGECRPAIKKLIETLLCQPVL